MKKIAHLTFIAFLVICMSTYSQSQSSHLKDYKVSFTSGDLYLIDIDGMEIVGYSGSDVVITSPQLIREENDRSRGLKLVNSLGLDDNTGFGISVIKEGSKLIARQVSQNCDCENIKIKVPNGVNVYIEHISHNAERITVRDFSSELNISTNHHSISLDNVTGPMAVKTFYGEIDAKFSSVSQTGSVSLYSVYEFVDVTIPKSAKINISIYAPYGDVYSNANIEVTNNNFNDENSKQSNDGQTLSGVVSGGGHNHNSNSCTSREGTSMRGTINGGGVEFYIKSSYEDLYIRQK